MQDDSVDLIKNNPAISGQLRQTLLDEYRPLLEHKKAVFIDYPMHLNIGDLLIQEGTEYLFKSLKVDVIARISERNQNRLFKMSIPEDTILVLHGGGNFGDLYPRCQALREKIIHQFPNHTILLMPQSVHYRDEQNLINIAPLYAQHQHLYVYVRDQVSHSLLSEHLTIRRLKLMPDMAFLINDLWQEKPLDDASTLIFRRRDIESSLTAEAKHNAFDWDDVFSANDLRFYTFIRALARVENKLKLNLGIDYAWRRFSRKVINQAVAFYAPYNTIDTDRLHGMILALLTGCHVIKRDNSYGKLTRYAQCWLGLKPSSKENVKHTC